MQKLTLLLFLIIACFTVTGQSSKDFEWLKGKWERQNTKKGTNTFEIWDKNSENNFVGQGITMSGSDTVFVEKLSILQKDNILYYVADTGQNPAPTYFKITAYSKNRFTCENPDHDFPKKIEYQLKGDLMIATISGDGKEIPFVFKKIE